MTLSRRLLALICTAAAMGATAFATPPALAAGNAIINDCQSNGQLTHPYTVAQLRHALSVMPASVKQYTSCFDVVQNALVSARKNHGTTPVSSSKGSSSFLPTPVIIILVVLILGALTFGALAIRRRRGGAEGDGGPDGPAGPGGTATRRMPTSPPPAGGGDTAETRVMPSPPPSPPAAGPSDEAPTRIDGRAEDERS
jgi:H+/Cl- antiporter ClcA